MPETSKSVASKKELVTFRQITQIIMDRKMSLVNSDTHKDRKPQLRDRYESFFQSMYVFFPNHAGFAMMNPFPDICMSQHQI